MYLIFLLRFRQRTSTKIRCGLPTKTRRRNSSLKQSTPICWRTFLDQSTLYRRHRYLRESLKKLLLFMMRTNWKDGVNFWRWAAILILIFRNSQRTKNQRCSAIQECSYWGRFVTAQRGDHHAHPGQNVWRVCFQKVAPNTNWKIWWCARWWTCKSFLVVI